MLKKPIEAGRKYRDGLDEERGPMAISAQTGMWVCQKTKKSYYNDGSSSEFNATFDLVSRVKTPKADRDADSKPAKVKKWREAWVVMKDGEFLDDRFFSGIYANYQQGIGKGYTQHPARVCIEPEE